MFRELDKQDEDRYRVKKTEYKKLLKRLALNYNSYMMTISGSIMKIYVDIQQNILSLLQYYIQTAPDLKLTYKFSELQNVCIGIFEKVGYGLIDLGLGIAALPTVLGSLWARG
jgi:hypothetical protein